MKQPKTAVIIVNWNGKHLLKGCLDSVFKQTYKDFNVILVDNGSNDGSVEFVRNNYDKVKLISLDSNTGFAKGNNIGIKEAFKDEGVKYIALLNNDTEVDKNWLKELIKIAETDNKIGMCSSKLLSFYDHNKIDRAGLYISLDGFGGAIGSGEIDDDKYSTVKDIFGADGAACLYKKELLDKVGLFDEDFFAYCEDLDLAWRSRLAGWTCMYVPNSKVFHMHSMTGKTRSIFKVYHLERNRIWLVIKNYPMSTVILSIPYSIKRYFNFILLANKRNTDANKFIESTSFLSTFNLLCKSYFHALVKLPYFYKKRRLIQSSRTVSKKEIRNWFKLYAN